MLEIHQEAAELKWVGRHCMELWDKDEEYKMESNRVGSLKTLDLKKKKADSVFKMVASFLR